jgi:hypothetical protein
VAGTVDQIEILTAFPGRSPGSDAERRAAVDLQRRLAGLGREAEVQAIHVHPRFGLANAVHALLAIGGSVAAVSAPAPGAAVVLLAAVLTMLDVSGTLPVVRRLLGRRASQNVESRERTDKPGTLVVTAAYDAPRPSGAMALATRLLRDPWLAMVLAMAVILGCCGARLAGVDGTPLTAAQFVPTVMLILLVPALVDVELSGAGEDRRGAGAVAVALALGDELGARLEHFDVWVLLTGATQPFAEGMGAWLRRRRKGLDRERTAILALGPAGEGPVRFTRREGPLLAARCHRDLLRLGKEVAEDSGGGADTYVSRTPSAASRALARRLPAITVSTGGEGDASGQDLARLQGFCRELAERLDAEVGPSLAPRG